MEMVKRKHRMAPAQFCKYKHYDQLSYFSFTDK